ncbi:ApaLI family restriction endonuclease [Leuconostoc gelidum subsp. gasicomitatum]|uniref:ApaLI family restriction endonuclease n=1 Tax=Leuconostoc gasicomitatum TaxID=115778 RepID=UPI001CC45A59|nr:ApaLI family restriction endonuclease [Leuconostoc gasicomitatum]MBZ5959716.1 ApaLI family restriction endonuclease [Leuconostoc gasicomitatum]MBZ5994197.1 ApaLI family restriction endonuclease [Leuconostoc gasicomitatum]
MDKDIKNKIRVLANKYADNLKIKVDQRVEDMQLDNKDHYLVYRVLGVTDQEGDLVDLYQNKGRFLYKYAGSFLEEAATICFIHKFGENDAKKVKIDNTLGIRPKQYEIDCLVNSKDAHEIKWRDATTDGDHITKEHNRIQVIKKAGYKPIRVMFFYPNRSQAIRIQKTLETLYHGIGGDYYYGNSAWNYVESYTGVDLKTILEEIATENLENGNND